MGYNTFGTGVRIMKYITKPIFVLTALFLLPVQTLANDLDIRPYVSGGLGAYVLGPGSGSDTVFGGYGAVGADVMPNLALEIRMGATANGSNAGSTFGTDWFVSYLAKPQLQIAHEVNIYGLIGASTIRSWRTPTGGTKLSATKTSFSFGGGIEYMLNDDFSIGIEGMVLDSQDKSNRTPYDGNYIAAGVGTIRINF